MASTGTSPSRQGNSGTPHAQAPIRWPRPERGTVIAIVAWVVGLLIALIVPALIVSPSKTTAPVDQAWTAFGFTALGAVIMFAATISQWRRTGDAASMVLGAVPASTVVVGGIILTTSKIYGG